QLDDDAVRLVREKQVRRLDVAMDDVFGVRLDETGARLARDAKREIGRQRAGRFEQPPEIVADEVFHRDERHAELRVAARVDDLDDVTRLDPSRSSRFALEANDDL